MDNYILLLKDSILSSFILGLDKEFAIHVMKIQSYSKVSLFFVFFVGALIGSYLNYTVGFALRLIIDRFNIVKSRKEVIKATIMMQKYWYLVSLFSFVDFWMKVSTLFFGMYKLDKPIVKLMTIALIRTSYCFFV